MCRTSCVGGASGQLKGDRHLAFPTKTITTGNLLLSILNLFGVHQESIGDSTGFLTGLVKDMSNRMQQCGRVGLAVLSSLPILAARTAPWPTRR